MKTYPKAQVLFSRAGVENIEVLYLPGQRTQAWQFCQALLPLVGEFDSQVLLDEELVDHL
jgi:hypothetical protein